MEVQLKKKMARANIYPALSISRHFVSNGISHLILTHNERMMYPCFHLWMRKPRLREASDLPKVITSKVGSHDSNPNQSLIWALTHLIMITLPGFLRPKQKKCYKIKSGFYNTLLLCIIFHSKVPNRRIYPKDMIDPDCCGQVWLV